MLLRTILFHAKKNDDEMFLWRKKFGHRCGPLLMVILSLIVVIEHIIFLMRSFFFWYLWIQLKEWWFDIVHGPPVFKYMKKCFYFFVVISVKNRAYCWLYKSHHVPCVLINSLFIHQLCNLSSDLLLFHCL